MISFLYSRRFFVLLTSILLICISMVAVSRAQSAPTPQVWSVTLDTSPTPLDTMHFVVTFSEAVTGVDITDFSLSGDIGTATISQVEARTATVYVVTITNTPASQGLILVVLDDDSIRNTAGTPLGGLGASNGSMASTAVVVVAAVQPTATALAVAQPQNVQPASLGREVGQYTSLTLTKNNTAVMSYYDDFWGDLKLAICNNLPCTAPTIRTIDRLAVGLYTSLKLTTSGNPVISYYGGKLKLAICNNPACTAPTIRIVDSTGVVGWFSSLKLTTGNIPVISYYDATNGDLKLAICNNPTCTTPTIRIVDSTADIGQYTSLALTASNIPVISYYATTGDLKLAICNNSTCTAPSISTIDSTGDVGQYNSLVLTSDNVPFISYIDASNGNLKIVNCITPNCTNPTISLVDSTGTVDFHTSLALTTGNIPVISYYDTAQGDLKLAICNDLTCTTPTTSIIDSTGNVGKFSSLALLKTNQPLTVSAAISYYDISNGNLKFYIGDHPLRPAITIDQGQPFLFAKLAPANNAINQLTTVSLSWTESTYAASYEYCYATSIAACTNWTSTSGGSVLITGLSDNTTYYWQVRAVNPSGSIEASAGYWQFKTAK